MVKLAHFQESMGLKSWNTGCAWKPPAAYHKPDYEIWQWVCM